jgi:hypothetical protein
MTLVSLVTKPTADKEVQESILRLLREALEEAERGEIDNLIMIIGTPAGEWTDRASDTVKFSEAIGRLEITKQEWIAKYFKGRE